jgi:hypothetical protein
MLLGVVIDSCAPTSLRKTKHWLKADEALTATSNPENRHTLNTQYPVADWSLGDLKVDPALA